MENVDVENKSEIFANVGKSGANKLYKEYVKWFKKQNGEDKEPMSFCQFLDWAKDRDIITPKAFDANAGVAPGKMDEAEKPKESAPTFDGKKIISRLLLFSLSAVVVTAVLISLTKK